MYKLVIAFCFLVTVLTALKYWLKQDSCKYKVVATILAVCSGITGYFVLYEMLPTPASPQINNLYFYADETLNSFEYVCEFLVRNDGDTPCVLETVEFLLADAEFKNAKSGRIAVGTGGGGGGGLLNSGGGTTRDEIVCAYLPQKLPPMNLPFCIIGKAESSTLEEKKIFEADANILIRFHYISNGREFIEEKEVPIIFRNIDSIKF